MSQPPSRRRVLSLAAGTAAAAPLGYAATVAHAAPTTPAPATPAPPTWAVRPFPLDQVTLGDGVFRRKRDLMLDYARAYPADRILAVFRANAGLDTRGARPPGGWETSDGNLRGHYGGHFLTLVAQAYADTREAALKAKLDYLVTALGECQQALAEHGSPRPSHPGYLAAYPETFKRAEPVVVFGATDSGVPNRARGDGLTFLDVLWEQAPFVTAGRFVRAVRTLADGWLSEGLLTRTERDRVVAAAVDADLRR